MAACHQSSTTVASGSTLHCSRHSPASPSHSTVAGAFVLTPAGGEHLPECRSGGRLALARESEAVLGASGIDDLACDHLEVAFLASLPVAHVAAIKSDHDGAGPLRRGLRRYLEEVRLHNVLAYAQRPVAHGAGVLRPAHWRHLGQEGATLPNSASAAYRAVT